MESKIEIDWSLEAPDPTLIEFVPNFQENRKKELSEFKSLLAVKDFSGLKKLGHNWKGFSRPYGYIALEKMGKALELAAGLKDIKQCESLFHQFLIYINEKDVQMTKASRQN